jgi:hypothetical protein
MKEATGELNMTVITLVAIAAIGAVFYFLVWPLVQRTLATNSCRTAYGAGYTAKEMEVLQNDSQATVKDWCCCPPRSGNVNVDGLQAKSLSDGDPCEENCTTH